MIIRIRAIVGVMIFFGYFIIYLTRYNLSVHIVDMMGRPQKNSDLVNTYRTYNQSKRDVFPKHTFLRSGNIFDIMYWSESKVSLLLAAYHIGYCVCFPIFHNFGDRYGPMWVVGVGGLSSGILNCLTPASAYYNYWLLFLFRVLIGFCAGAMSPSMVQVLRHWVPPTERQYFMWAYCGVTLGTCCTFLICAAVQYYSTWSVGFYLCGTAQIIWAVGWLLAVTDSPLKHPFISEEELSYLITTIGNVFTIKLTNTEAPWRLILKSASFWALCILSFGYSWMIISVCLHCPLYYSINLYYSIYEASALTALPFLIRLVLGTVTIQIYHWYKNNMRIKRIRNIRKYFIVVSHVIPGTMISLCWFFPINPGPYLLTTAIALTAAGMDLTLDISYELSPNYVNSINTVTKIVSNIPGIIIPLCVGEVIHLYKAEIYVWRYIWSFHATVLLVSGLIFLVWGDAHIQPWNEIRNRPHRKVIPSIRPSTMSNIPEMDEEESSNRPSTQPRIQRPTIFKSLRMSN